MAYCTTDDLRADLAEDELIQLTDDEGLGRIDEARVSASIADADSLIDGYLVGGGYTVPLAPIPAIINRISRGLAIYNLHKRRFRREMPESMETDYKVFRQRLEAVQAGRIALDKDTPPIAGGGGYKTNKASSDRVFSKDTLTGF